MYLDCFKCHGKPYLRIVENYTILDGTIRKSKRKTIKNLGYLEKYDDGEPNFIQRMKKNLKSGNLKIDGLDPNDFREKAKLYNGQQLFNQECYLNPKNIGYFFLESIYNKLGIYDLLREVKSNSKIEYDINGLTKLLVFNRILNPSSKKQCFESKENYLFPITTSNDINDIYKALDVLDKKSKLIQNRMNTKIKNSSIGRNTSLTYYDVTNYYYEAMYGDDDIYKLDEEGNRVLNEKGKPEVLKKGFRKKGISKENQKGPIVQMGLFIDNNGIPVSHKLFPGNTQDKTTFKDVLENDIDEMGLGKIVLVADNGMNTQENKYLIINKGNGYIVSKSVKKSWTKVRDWALDDNDYTCLTNSSEEITFKYKSKINEIDLTYKNEDGTKTTKTIKEKEIIYWSKKQYQKSLRENEKFIEYLESCKENPDKLKDKQRKSQDFVRVIQTDKKTGEVIKTKAVVVLLEEKIKKYKETLGYYSIVTSEVEDDNKEIINRYHGLSRIEDSFRIIKSDLEGRPIYLRTEEHIKAHFLICFIALTVIKIIQYKVLKAENEPTLNVDGWEQGITAEKIKEALNDFQADKYDENSYKFKQPSEDILKILKIFNIEEFNFKLPSNQEVKKLKNNILNLGVDSVESKNHCNPL
ncbi:MAG: IS1634 family transposase [Bacilli bacterium]